jgi:methionyl-tRNA formyltransferase
MSVVVYVGKYRSRCGIDSGASLLRELRSAHIDISTVLVNAGDSLARELRNEFALIELPPVLSLPRAQMQLCLREPPQRARLTALVASLRALHLHAGLLYYGSWLPPEIATIPERGFLNFHPAPLPYLRGFECNTFAILRGCPRFHATVHLVTDDYDDGEAYAVSPEEDLDMWCVPPELLARVDRYAAQVLTEGLVNLTRNHPVGGAACPSDEPFVADRRRLLGESAIHWERDRLVDVWRRFRALCGQQTGLRLRAPLQGNLRLVEDLRVLNTRPTALPGTLVGACEEQSDWSGCPVVSCNGGTVAIKLGDPAPHAPSFHEGRPACVMNRDLLRERCLIPLGL